MPDIIVFGASITYGAWDPVGGWVQRLRTQLDKKSLRSPRYRSRVHNLGISSNTSVDLLRRFKRELEPRIFSGHKPCIVISIGLNDAAYNLKTKRPMTAPRRFKKTIAAIIRLAKRYTNQIVFVGLTPADEPRTNPVPWNRQKSYRNQYIREYNGYVQAICKRLNIHFINLISIFSPTQVVTLLVDGIHPNSLGHQMIYKRVARFLSSRHIL